MAEQQQSPVSKLIENESEQQRVERIRVEERKAHAARTTEALKRFGVE